MTDNLSALSYDGRIARLEGKFTRTSYWLLASMIINLFFGVVLVVLLSKPNTAIEAQKIILKDPENRVIATLGQRNYKNKNGTLGAIPYLRFLDEHGETELDLNSGRILFKEGSDTVALGFNAAAALESKLTIFQGLYIASGEGEVALEPNKLQLQSGNGMSSADLMTSLEGKVFLDMNSSGGAKWLAGADSEDDSHILTAYGRNYIGFEADKRGARLVH